VSQELVDRLLRLISSAEQTIAESVALIAAASRLSAKTDSYPPLVAVEPPGFPGEYDFSLVRTVHGHTVRVAVGGEVDMATSPHVAAALREAVTYPETATVVVNLRSVSFLDATGVRALLAARSFAIEHGVRLYLTDPSEAAVRVLRVAGVHGFLTDQ